MFGVRVSLLLLTSDLNRPPPRTNNNNNWLLKKEEKKKRSDGRSVGAMCCHFALYRRLLHICRPLETHERKAYVEAHPPTLVADSSAMAKGHRMTFSRADGLPVSFSGPPSPSSLPLV
jgi:hypothetical protein